MGAGIRATPLPSRDDPAVVAAREAISGVLRGAYDSKQGTIPLSAAQAIIAKLREGDDVITDEEAFAALSLLQEVRDGTAELENRFRELRAEIQANESRPGMAARVELLRSQASVIEARLDWAYAANSPLSHVVRVVEDERRTRIH